MSIRSEKVNSTYFLWFGNQVRKRFQILQSPVFWSVFPGDGEHLSKQHIWIVCIPMLLEALANKFSPTRNI